MRVLLSSEVLASTWTANNQALAKVKVRPSGPRRDSQAVPSWSRAGFPIPPVDPYAKDLHTLRPSPLPTGLAIADCKLRPLLQKATPRMPPNRSCSCTDTASGSVRDRIGATTVRACLAALRRKTSPQTPMYLRPYLAAALHRQTTCSPRGPLPSHPDHSF